MEISVTQNIYYSNKERIPLADVAKSLLALEDVSRLMPQILESLYEDLTVQNLSVFVDELESGSLKEKINYYLWVVFQQRLEDESGVKLRQLSNKSSEQKSNIVAWVVVAALIVALKVAADKVFPGVAKEKLTQQVNVTFSAGRDITGIDENMLRAVVEQAVEEDAQVIKAAVQFAQPAKRDRNAYIEFDKSRVLEPLLLAEVPGGLIEEDEKEKVIELQRTEVFIRATDKDSGKRGWGATIPEFNDKRIRMHVAPGIDLVFLAHQDVVVGDVAIFFSVDREGNIRKPHAHLYSIDKDLTVKAIKR